MTRRCRSSTGTWPACWPSGPRPEAEPRCPRLQGASALFDMIEYYESATHLNISFNKHIGTRGWQAAAHMMRKVGTPTPPPASPGWKELRHRRVQALCQGTQPSLAHPQEPRLDLPPGVSTSLSFPGCKTRWPRCSVGLGWAVPQGREGWGQPEPAPLLPPQTSCLQYLDARNTPLLDHSAPFVARALRIRSSLAVLHLENASLSGRPLMLLGEPRAWEAGLGLWAGSLGQDSHVPPLPPQPRP